MIEAKGQLSEKELREREQGRDKSWNMERREEEDTKQMGIRIKWNKKWNKVE